MQTGGLIPSWWERCILIYISSNFGLFQVVSGVYKHVFGISLQEVKSWLWISWLSVLLLARIPWCSRANAPTVWLADTSALLEHPALTSSPSFAPRAASSSVLVVADSPADTRSKQERTSCCEVSATMWKYKFSLQNWETAFCSLKKIIYSIPQVTIYFFQWKRCRLERK